MAWYRFLYIRNSLYVITPEVIRISRGIFFKRVDMVEMYRVKHYIITQPFMLQVFHLMDLTLKSTDPENPGGFGCAVYLNQTSSILSAIMYRKPGEITLFMK